MSSVGMALRRSLQWTGQRIKDDMVHHDKPNMLSVLRKLIHPLMHNTGNTWWSPRNLRTDLWKQVPNRVQLNKSDNKSTKALHIQSRRNHQFALPRTRAPLRVKPTSWSVFNLVKRTKPMKTTILTKVLPLFVCFWNTSQRLSKSTLPHLRPSIKGLTGQVMSTSSDSKKNWQSSRLRHDPRIALNSLCEILILNDLLFQILTHHTSLDIDTLSICSWIPLWIGSSTLLLILYSSTQHSRIWHFAYQIQTTMEPTLSLQP